MRFRLVPKSSTLELDDLERPWTAKTHSVAGKMRLLEPTAQIWIKIDPYVQRQKCRPMTLVCENITCMRTFEGVPLGGGLKWEWGCRRLQIFGDLSGHFFENFCRYKDSNIIWRYATTCRPVIDCKRNDLDWPWAVISCKTRFSY